MNRETQLSRLGWQLESAHFSDHSEYRASCGGETMKKIESLTKEQTDRFPEFVDKWTRIGLSTEPANRTEAERGVTAAYKIANLPKPKIVWCGSPFSQGLTRAIVLSNKLAASVRDSVRASVGASVRDSVRDSVGASVGDSVRDSVGASVGASVRDSVGASVGDSGYGQHDANWIGFYDFFRSVCKLETQTEKILGIHAITLNAGWWLPHKRLCWISERHSTLHRNNLGRLHKDGGPALEYPDGFSIWALNGIRMKPEYIKTPAEQLTPETVLAEPNADIRRELFRKVGAERMFSKLPHKKLHKRGNYELLSVDLPGVANDIRYLLMLNPSIGCFHMEAINKDECAEKTVDAALNWRNSQWFTDAEILT